LIKYIEKSNKHELIYFFIKVFCSVPIEENYYNFHTFLKTNIENKIDIRFEIMKDDKINKIAIETSSELLQKLIGVEVNNSSISAIVDDLSKRNGDKYYGN
jgi:hypothetical protein